MNGVDGKIERQRAYLSGQADPSDPMLEAATRYNPDQPAIVVFVDEAGETADFHVLTAIYGYTN